MMTIMALNNNKINKNKINNNNNDNNNEIIIIIIIIIMHSFLHVFYHDTLICYPRHENMSSGYIRTAMTQIRLHSGNV